MRRNFEEKLEELNLYLTKMGELCETAINLTCKALIEQNVALAKEAIICDGEIDALEKKIEDLCLKLLLLHHPVARDLRVISAALKMITDLERIGDQCADISEITIILSNQTYIKSLVHLPMMADATAKMVKDSINAYVNKDLNLAREVIYFDDEIDNLFLAIKTDLTNIIHCNPDSIGQAIDLLMIAKYFERIGDHAENVAEWVVFSITGSAKLPAN